jgi:hypothetical protein
MHLPEYLAEIVFPPILIDVTWLLDVGQDAPWTGRKCISDHYGISPEVIVPPIPLHSIALEGELY